FPGTPENYYFAVVQNQRAGIAEEDSSYLLHEFLAEVNQPLYYHEFLGRIAAEGLRAVADTDFNKNACVAAEPIRRALERMSDDPARQEQYYDLLVGRTFRRTILCREGVTPLPVPSESALERLQAAAKVMPGSLAPGLSTTMSETFRNWR